MEHTWVVSILGQYSMQMTSVWYHTRVLAFRKCWIFAITTELHGIFYLIQLRATSWLPVLSSIASPSLRRKVSTDNMLQIIEAHPNWPVYADVFEHPPPRLASWRPVWSDMTYVDTITQWREDWSSASVVNHIIVTDPTIWQPGFDLFCHTWSLMNRFWTG